MPRIHVQVRPQAPAHRAQVLITRFVAVLGMAFTAGLAVWYLRTYPEMLPPSSVLLVASLPMLLFWRLWMLRRWPPFVLLCLNGLVFLSMLPRRSDWGYATGAFEMLAFLLLSSLLLVGLLLVAWRALKPGL